MSDGSNGVLDYGVRVTPLSVRYDPSRELLITFEIPNGNGSNLATVWIPKRATNESARLEIDVDGNEGAFTLDGLNIGIQLIGETSGRLISSLLKPLELRPWFVIKTPRLIEDGNCSPQFIKLRTRYLPSFYVAGYFIDDKGFATLYTRKLSRVSNANLGSNEKLCLVDRVGFTPDTREFNRVIAANFSPNPYLLINLKDKFANRTVELQLRRSVNGETQITKIATITVNGSGDALLPLSEKVLKSDRFRIRLNKFPLAVKTVMLTNP